MGKICVGDSEWSFVSGNNKSVIVTRHQEERDVDASDRFDQKDPEEKD